MRSVLTLLPDPPELSEVCPRSTAHQDAESPDDDERTRPRSSPHCPRSHPATGGPAERKSGDDEERAVRGAQSLQTEPTSAVTDRLKDQGPGRGQLEEETDDDALLAALGFDLNAREGPVDPDDYATGEYDRIVRKFGRNLRRRIPR